ncbi:MAG TPA: acyl carrier protein [Acidimicrobiales bacterium]|nr:acyl carrier protein [Acidimicrobiales bacterium]
MTSSTLDEGVCRIIGSAIPGAAARGVTPSMRLRGDLDIDSIGLMSIVFLLEEETGIDVLDRVDDVIGAEYVSDIIEIVRQA